MIDGRSQSELGLTHVKVDSPTGGEIKLEAIKLAGRDIGIIPEVEGHKGIPSGVPEQPHTVQLGFAGGKNRIEGLGPKTNPVIAIENFIDQTCILGPETGNGTMIHDIGAVVSRKPDGRYHIASSAGIRFPQEYYHEANIRGFANHTIGEVLAEDPALANTDVAKNPHRYYTGGAYGREDFLTLPSALMLMRDKASQGPKIEESVRNRILKSGLKLPENMNILSTSEQGIKNGAIENVLTMLNASSHTVEGHDGNPPQEQGQLTTPLEGFQSAFNRLQVIHKDGLPRRPGDVTISIQNCLCPVQLDAETRYLDTAVVLIEKIDADGTPRYYSSVSAGVEFPPEVVKAAVAEGVTVGQKLAELQGFNPADPHKGLYNVSRQVFLEEAIFAAFAQMQSGLEVE